MFQFLTLFNLIYLAWSIFRLFFDGVFPTKSNAVLSSSEAADESEDDALLFLFLEPKLVQIKMIINFITTAKVEKILLIRK
jgi:hypothetical protein